MKHKPRIAGFVGDRRLFHCFHDHQPGVTLMYWFTFDEGASQPMAQGHPLLGRLRFDIRDIGFAPTSSTRPWHRHWAEELCKYLSERPGVVDLLAAGEAVPSDFALPHDGFRGSL